MVKVTTKPKTMKNSTLFWLLLRIPMDIKLNLLKEIKSTKIKKLGINYQVTNIPSYRVELSKYIVPNHQKDKNKLLQEITTKSLKF